MHFCARVLANLARLLVNQLLSSQLAEFVINHGQKGMRGLRLILLDGVQKLRYITHTMSVMGGVPE